MPDDGGAGPEEPAGPAAGGAPSGGPEAEGSGRADAAAGPLWLHAVVRQPLTGRARRWLRPGRRAANGDEEGTEAALPGLDGTRRVHHEGLAAVVSPAVGPGVAASVDERLDRHARVVEALAGSGAVVPAPPGLRAPGESAVRDFLDRARLALQEALERFDGACEVRLHVRRRAGAGDPDGDAAAAAGLYHRLRRHARAARRLPTAGDDLLTAAFLVPRAGWSEGTGLAARWQERRPGLEVEVSGPWAPYDFVRMFPVDAP